MIEFKMPALGSDMDEGTLQEWLVKPGDEVARGQVVAVVETTKAAVEIECWHAGTVQDLLVPVGDTVQVGTPLATLVGPDETDGGTRSEPAVEATAPAVVEPAVTVPPSPPGAFRRRRWVSPAARRLAASLSVAVDALAGSGPQGAVTLTDVEHAAAVAPREKPKATAVSDRAAQRRKSIAAAMSRSKREIPHSYLADEILMDRALTWLTERNAQRPITERVLPAVLQLKAVAVAAARYGEFNGFWREQGYEAATG
ncbi:biotin/lipoyl-containing protein, partial [Mycolicibacterium hippocampi]